MTDRYTKDFDSSEYKNQAPHGPSWGFTFLIAAGIVLFFMFDIAVFLVLCFYFSPAQKSPVKKVSVPASASAAVSHSRGKVRGRPPAAKLREFSIPRYGKLSNTDMNDIGIDNKNGHLCLVSDSIWGEIPLKDGSPLFGKGFMAGTKNYKLRAVAEIPGDVAVFDVNSNTVMAGHKAKYKVDLKISDPAAMAFLNGLYYVSNPGESRLYELKPLDKSSVKVARIFKVPEGLCGLAVRKGVLWGCSRNMLYRFGRNINVELRCPVEKPLNGIAFSKDGDLWALAPGKNTIYRIELPPDALK